MPNQNVVPQAAPAVAPVAAAAPVGKPSQAVDLATEYSYVGKELRRLGVTAAALIVAEIVLNLVLRQVL